VTWRQRRRRVQGPAVRPQSWSPRESRRTAWQVIAASTTSHVHTQQLPALKHTATSANSRQHDAGATTTLVFKDVTMSVEFVFSRAFAATCGDLEAAARGPLALVRVGPSHRETTIRCGRTTEARRRRQTTARTRPGRAAASRLTPRRTALDTHRGASSTWTTNKDEGTRRHTE
jgi:hypothetical protein